MENKYFVKYDENYVVYYTHYMPFNANYGLKKTAEELLLEGALVDAYEKALCGANQIATYKYNPIENKVYYEIKDIEIKNNMSDKERIEELQAKLFEQEQMLANLSYEIMMSQMREGE